MSARLRSPVVISWDVSEDVLSDGSSVFNVVGTSDECRVTFDCIDEASADALAETLRSDTISNASAERL